MSTEIITTGRIQGISVNTVLRNTYWLLSLTLAFAALTAGISMALNLPHPGLLLTLAGYFGLLFLTSHFRDSALGLVCVFGLTGFMGYTLGPILNATQQLRISQKARSWKMRRAILIPPLGEPAHPPISENKRVRPRRSA